MASDLEITIHSARGLKNVNWKHGELRPYAKVWLEGGDGDGDGDGAAAASTRIDASGDTDPSWEQKLVLAASKAQLQGARLVVAIYHEAAENPEKPEKAKVGAIAIALTEVVDAGGFEETLDYDLPLKRPSGRPHGKVRFSARLRERRYPAPPPPPPVAGDPSARDLQPPYPSAYQGYPPPAAAPYGQHSYAYPPQPAPAYAGYGEPASYGYGEPASYGYGQSQAPPAPAGYGYGYGYGQQQAPLPSGYGQQQAPPPSGYGYAQPQAPPPSDYYQQQQQPPKKSSNYGGLAAGLAVGALAGGVGALALNEYVEHEEDEAAQEQAYEDAQRYEAAQDDYAYDGDDF